MVKFYWYKAGFDNVLAVMLTVRNTKSVDVKDIVVRCNAYAESGTLIDENERTDYLAHERNGVTLRTWGELGQLDKTTWIAVARYVAAYGEEVARG